MWVFDLTTNTWQPVNLSGNMPSPRSGHTAHVFGQRIIYNGGCNTEIDTCYNEVWQFDRRTYEFQIIYDAKFYPKKHNV